MANYKEREHKTNSGKPKAGAGDYAHAIARAGLSTIPVVGGAIKEFFNTIIVPPLQKHLIEWIESLERELKKLEETVEGFKIENLNKNSVFATKFSYALQIAIRNHRIEKLNALRNAVLNTALSPKTDPEEALQHMFLNFVDVLTPWHLKILKFFDDPHDWVEKNKIDITSIYMDTVSNLLKRAFPELRKDFYTQICQDLFDRGLITTDKTGINTLMKKESILAKRITEMGKKFLDFISSPFKE